MALWEEQALHYKSILTTKLIIQTIFIFAFLFPFQGVAQDVNVLLREADHLEDLKKENDAYKKYLEILKIYPNHLPALCKASELCSMIGNRQAEKSSKLNYFKEARRYAETALHVNPAYPDANFVMSMAMGRMALVLSGREKIAAVNDIKKYAELAIRYDPKNFKAYHVLGKWHFEVSSLNSFERIAVKVLFGGMPPSSFNESIKCYEKSRLLKPDFILNYLEIAKAYRKNNQDAKAIEVLKKLQVMPVKMADDPRVKTEGYELMKKLQ